MYDVKNDPASATEISGADPVNNYMIENTGKKPRVIEMNVKN